MSTDVLKVQQLARPFMEALLKHTPETWTHFRAAAQRALSAGSYDAIVTFVLEEAVPAWQQDGGEQAPPPVPEEPAVPQSTEPSPPGALQITISDATFAVDVLERSQRRSVFVQFSAEWCSFCHQVTPMMKKFNVDAA